LSPLHLLSFPTRRSSDLTIRPPAGIISHPFDGMQIQAPRTVLAEAAMDTLFLSYADPELAAEVILGHFESSPHPNLPCMREDGRDRKSTRLNSSHQIISY